MAQAKRNEKKIVAATFISAPDEEGSDDSLQLVEETNSTIELDESPPEEPAAPNLQALQEIEQELSSDDIVNAPINAVADLPANADDSLGMYLRELGQMALLTFQEELALGQVVAVGRLAESRLLDNGYYTPIQLKALKSGDYLGSGQPELAECEQQVVKGGLAFDRLVQSNLRLVVSVARKYRERGLTFQDLIQEGNMGLIRAAEKYDYALGYKFSTYATWWIRQSITRAIADQSRTIRLPVHIGERLAGIYQAKRRLMQELGREPTQEEIAKALSISIFEVAKLQRLEQQTVSLDSPIGDEKDSSLGDFIEDSRSQLDVENGGNDALLKEDMSEVLSHLSDREALIIRLRYGIADGQQRTLEEVGQQLGVTRERIRQIEAKALRKLRHPRFGKKLRGYLD